MTTAGEGAVMVHGKGKHDVTGWGRHRPAWRPAARVGRVALTALLVLSVVAAGTWWIYRDVDARFVLVVLAAWALVVAAAWWLGSAWPGALIAACGVMLMLIAGPIWLDDAVLAARGHTVVARVSRVDTSQSRQHLDYTVWLTDPAGRAIARPLLTYGPPPPLAVGDAVTVLADPLSELDTEPVDRNSGPWMLALLLSGVTAVVVGLAVSARDRPPGSGGGSRPGSGGRSSRPASGRTRR
ncbi:hypothetical protein [Kutzneria sp. NPDC052558]|uniref:hypothetical protein n=1 Tax=Kutzneria sp. NPDC052558 TaxID=3364121 RepID=UPI0037CB3975